MQKSLSETSLAGRYPKLRKMPRMKNCAESWEGIAKLGGGAEWAADKLHKWTERPWPIHTCSLNAQVNFEDVIAPSRSLSFCTGGPDKYGLVIAENDHLAAIRGWIFHREGGLPLRNVGEDNSIWKCLISHGAQLVTDVTGKKNLRF